MAEATVTERVERRLAAILAADVFGYSRLMGADEEGTLSRLKAHRRELVDPAIKRHRGRIVKTTGDGILVEFASPVEAVRCAAEVQRGMVARDADVAPEKRITFRVGINLGDVIAEKGDLFGDGVNVAARLETLSEPGGIAISRTVRDQIRDRLPFVFADAGEHEVKNIARPVRVYALSAEAVDKLDADIALQVHEARSAWRNVAAAVERFMPPGSEWRPGLAAVAIVLLAAAGATSWYFVSRHQQTSQRLSIVVLPFSNLSNDPEQEYFADAVTNDLTTDLSRIEDSFVIAPNTARTYKGRHVDAKQIGRELNVRYILEGSLRRIGNQVRINAQLIDTDTAATIWSDRFDGDWTQSMKLEDEVTGRLARRLDLELTNEESRRSRSERPDNPDAVDFANRAWSVLNRPYSREQLEQSRDLFEQGLHIDPALSKALVGLALTLAIEVNYRWSANPEEALAKADAAASRVLSSSPNDAMAHFVKGEILRASGKNFESAIDEYQAAIAINPSLAPAYASLGNAKIRAGKAEEAFTPLQTAIRLSPRDPMLGIWDFNICHAYSHLGQDNDVIEWCRRSVAESPFWIAYVDLASAYAWTGRKDEAQTAVVELLKLMPNYTVDRWEHAGFSNNPVFLTQYQRITEGLRRAGLPEK
jgi:adenylate cyclase